MKTATIRVLIDSETKEKYKEYTDSRGITINEDLLMHIYNLIGEQYGDCDHNNKNAEIYHRFNNIYNILKDARFERCEEVFECLKELECLV